MRRSALSRTRRAHEDQLLELLRRHGPLTRGQLSELSGITRSTVSEIVTDMLNRPAITLDGNDTERPGRGRRAERGALDPSADQYLGIEFAHDGACFQLANASLSVIAQRHCIYPFNAPGIFAFVWRARRSMSSRTCPTTANVDHHRTSSARPSTRHSARMQPSSSKIMCGSPPLRQRAPCCRERSRHRRRLAVGPRHRGRGLCRAATAVRGDY